MCRLQPCEQRVEPIVDRATPPLQQGPYMTVVERSTDVTKWQDLQNLSICLCAGWVRNRACRVDDIEGSHVRRESISDFKAISANTHPICTHPYASTSHPLATHHFVTHPLATCHPLVPALESVTLSPPHSASIAELYTHPLGVHGLCCVDSLHIDTCECCM